MVIVM